MTCFHKSRIYEPTIFFHEIFRVSFSVMTSTYSEVPNRRACSLRFFRFYFHPACNFSCNKKNLPCLFINLLSNKAGKVEFFSDPALFFRSALLLGTSEYIGIFDPYRKLQPYRKTKQQKICEKNRRSVVSEFVKTCDELDLSNAKSECLGLSTSTKPQGYCLPRTLRPEIKEI